MNLFNKISGLVDQEKKRRAEIEKKNLKKRDKINYYLLNRNKPKKIIKNIIIS